MESPLRTGVAIVLILAVVGSFSMAPAVAIGTDEEYCEDDEDLEEILEDLLGDDDYDGDDADSLLVLL